MKLSPLWIALPVIGLLSWCAGLGQGKASRDDDALNAQYAAAVKLAGEWKSRYQVLKDDSVAQEKEARRLRNALSVERAGADSAAVYLRDAWLALGNAKTAADSLPHAIRWATQAEIRGGHLQRSLDIAMAGWAAAESERVKWKQLADEAEPVIAHLQASLEAERDARRCRIGVGFLSVGCPSWGTAGLVGAALGAVTVVVLKP